ncbi:MAG: glycosyltransferase [Betaproteobacteria bacterium]|nr:glycosyltransferase [Betaproteobacteria bacterium]
MNLLVITDLLPTPDRNSADFRFARLLGMLAGQHSVWLCVLGQVRQTRAIGAEAVGRYQRDLAALGVHLCEGGATAALQARDYTAVLFEWHFPAKALVERVRLLQPRARMVVDSVDVVFHRLEAKARITGRADDVEKAARTKAEELAVYAQSDLVITVTDADAQILRDEVPTTPTFTIPNIHPLEQPVAAGAAAAPLLLFIGSYARPGGETNIDAMRYFCGEVLPLVVAAVPEARLRIVGGPRNADIDALASPHVEVLGFVPETRPYLQTSAISIAPLRFGGGMKGKIGEAMSFGLPVVTTTTGIEGFGLTAGEHALVGDTARTFADHVIALLREPALRQRVGMAGHRFISEHYSDVAVQARVAQLFAQLARYPVKRLSLAQRTRGRLQAAWGRQVGWRLGAGR